MNRFVLLLFLIPAKQLLSQNTLLKDSLTIQLSKDSLRIYKQTKAKLYLRLESRNSFINREPVRLYGFLAGATFFERHIICGGIYSLDKRKESPLSNLDRRHNANHFLSLSYVDVSYQYVLFNHRYVQFNIPLEIGYGKFRVSSEIKGPGGNFSGYFVPIGASVQVICKPIRWAGISMIGGYRYVNNKHLRLNLEGFYYSVGLWIDARQVLRDFSYHKKKKKYRKLLEK